MAETINPLAPPAHAHALTFKAAQPASRTADVQPERDAMEVGTDPVYDAARLAVAGMQPPFLPDVPGPHAPRDAAADWALEGLSYRQRRLAEAIHILTELAGARMESVGRAKVRFAQNEVTAALQAAELELKNVQAQRRSAWVKAGTDVARTGTSAVSDPASRVGLAVLIELFKVLDKTQGFERAADDAQCQKSFVAIRERLNKQMEDMQGNEYEKAIRLLERSLETTRQMATSNTDTVRGVSQNL